MQDLPLGGNVLEIYSQDETRYSMGADGHM